MKPKQKENTIKKIVFLTQTLFVNSTHMGVRVYAYEWVYMGVLWSILKCLSRCFGNYCMLKDRLSLPHFYTFYGLKAASNQTKKKKLTKLNTKRKPKET